MLLQGYDLFYRFLKILPIIHLGPSILRGPSPRSCLCLLWLLALVRLEESRKQTASGQDGRHGSPTSELLPPEEAVKSSTGVRPWFDSTSYWLCDVE